MLPWRITPCGPPVPRTSSENRLISHRLRPTQRPTHIFERSGSDSSKDEKEVKNEGGEHDHDDDQVAHADDDDVQDEECDAKVEAKDYDTDEEGDGDRDIDNSEDNDIDEDEDEESDEENEDESEDERAPEQCNDEDKAHDRFSETVSQPALDSVLGDSGDIVTRNTGQDKTDHGERSKQTAAEDEAVSLVAKVIVQSAVSLALHLDKMYTSLAIKVLRKSSIFKLIAWATQPRFDNQPDAYNLYQLYSTILVEPGMFKCAEEAYAKLCQKLFRLSVPKVAQSKGITYEDFQVFWDCLTRLCQEYVADEWSKSINSLAQSSSSQSSTISDETEKVDRFPQRCRVLMRFVVELFKLSMVKNTTMSNCLSNSLLLSLEAPRDGDIVFVCQLLMEAGIKLDQGRAGHVLMDAHIMRMTSLANQRHLSIESRFMIHDVIYSRRYRWAPCDLIDAPDMASRVQSLLTVMDELNIESTFDEILSWANESKYEKDGRIVRQIIILIFDKAVDDHISARLCAKLCQSLMENLLHKVQDIHIIDTDRKPVHGRDLFRKYVLHRVQEDHQKEPDVSSRGSSNTTLNDRSTFDDHTIPDEHQFGRKARRLGFFYLLGELFKCKVTTEQAVHERIQGILEDPQGCTDEDIECLYILLKLIGKRLDHIESAAYMDSVFTRICKKLHSETLSKHACGLLQEIVSAHANSRGSNVEVAEQTTSEILIRLLTRPSENGTPSLRNLTAWIESRCQQENDTRTSRHLVFLIFQLAIHTTTRAYHAQTFKYLIENSTCHVNDHNSFDANGNLLRGSQLFMKYILDRAHYEFDKLWHRSACLGEPLLREQSKFDLAKALHVARIHPKQRFASLSGHFRYPHLDGHGRSNFIKFICKLHQVEVLTGRMFRRFVGKLLQIPSPDHEDVDLLYDLLCSVKGRLPHYEAEGYLRNHLSRMKVFVKDEKLGYHVRMAILDSINLYEGNKS